MRQVVQPAGGGRPVVVTAPAPSLVSTGVLVATSATLISAGTERAATQLAQASLAQKARARPDLVRQVISKARTDGLKATIGAVRSRLADDLALGYSGAGRVIEIGDAVRGFRAGDRVATAGGGYASHAEMQMVPHVLAAKIPDEVADDAATFATVASVGLHGLRLSDIRIGSKVVVVGLGLIGQLTARIAVASGCDVFGIDLDPSLVEVAAAHGVTAAVESGRPTTDAVLEWSRGRGADTVVITAGDRGDSRIIQSVPERCRDRAVVVAVGDIGLDLDRNAFYSKELRLEVARSYGPGRYDRSYEEWGVDYPVGHVRWTEGRNLEAVLDLMANCRLDVADLVTHRYSIDEAAQAYSTLDEPGARAIGIVLTYPTTADPEAPGPTSARTVRRTVAKAKRSRAGNPRVGLIGVGNFVRNVVVPSLREAGAGPIVHVASASGVSAARFAERHAVPSASSDADAVIGDPDVDLVVIATPHSSHAELVVQAVQAGKSVYCEKPLALTWDELTDVQEALADAPPTADLYVGFNRRYAPMAVAARKALRGTGPVRIEYRINAGALPAGHWYADRREGGRLHGEVCHFVDTAGFLTGDQGVTDVRVVATTIDPHDSYHLFIEYDDGSSASIVYADAGHPTTPKERIEVNGRGHTVVIDNFRKLVVDGDSSRVDAGKGHAEGLAGFLAGAPGTDSRTAISTTHAVLRAADRLSC